MAVYRGSGVWGRDRWVPGAGLRIMLEGVVSRSDNSDFIKRPLGTSAREPGIRAELQLVPGGQRLMENTG